MYLSRYISMCLLQRIVCTLVCTCTISSSLLYSSHECIIRTYRHTYTHIDQLFACSIQLHRLSCRAHGVCVFHICPLGTRLSSTAPHAAVAARLQAFLTRPMQKPSSGVQVRAITVRTVDVPALRRPLCSPLVIQVRTSRQCLIRNNRQPSATHAPGGSAGAAY